MNEVKDPEIKLFGKKIALPENGKITTVGPGGSSPGNISAEEQMNTCLEQNKVGTAEEVEGEEKGETEKDKASEEELRENKQQEDDDQDQIDGNNPQQKTLNKPDKILPCPRCNSKDTKFCYFNNYNANQPRYFCKTCQRYWTAGGTMRNMPVGAGRRKTKNLASNFRHISISQALREACFDSPDLICHHPSFKINGSTVLSFASSHEKKKGGENGGDFSTKSSVRTSNLAVESGRNGAFAPKVQTVMHGFPSPMQCLPPIPWPYPFPPIYPSGIPVPFFPSPYWNCGFPGPWTIPWPCHPNSNSNSNSTSNSNSPSPTLGKHPRDGDLNESRDSKKSEASILVPKTLRIDDPDEAVRSSIWTTLGIKNEFSRGSIFKGFQSNGEEKKEKDRVDMSSPVFKANPAALSRSLSFQEN